MFISGSLARIFSIWLLFEFILSVLISFLASDIKMPPASGGFAPLTPWLGFTPVPHWELCPQTPAIARVLRLPCTPELHHLLNTTVITGHGAHTVQEETTAYGINAVLVV